MPEIDEQEELQESDLESPPPSSQEGYAITIRVLPTGFSVSGPDPLPPTPSTPTEDDEPIADSTTMLKEVLAILQENPLGDDANEQLESGYKSA